MFESIMAHRPNNAEGKPSLSEMYAMVCENYRKALDSMWETDSYWIGDGIYETLEVADCYISNWELRYIVDTRMDFVTFYEWNDYNTDVWYGIELGYEYAHKILIEQWQYVDRRIPKETLKSWREEYLKALTE